MKIILLGASGMVGAGALREALAASEVEAVLSVGRRSCGVAHPKLRELLLADLFDFESVEDQLAGYDACIWAVGISSVGLDEAAYARMTEELTLVWARGASRARSGRCRSGTRVPSGPASSGRDPASEAGPAHTRWESS
jgi:putative NADH-flavin reductase